MKDSSPHILLTHVYTFVVESFFFFVIFVVPTQFGTFYDLFNAALFPEGSTHSPLLSQDDPISRVNYMSFAGILCDRNKTDVIAEHVAWRAEEAEGNYAELQKDSTAHSKI